MVTEVYGVMWLPVGAVAEMLQVSRQRIYGLISEGKLQGMKISGTTLVNRASVNARILELSNLKRSK
jgi:excisionase family DNA binding protein